MNAELKKVYDSNKLLNNSVIGYRKIKTNDSTKRGKCNIDFAFEVFDYIKEHKSQNISVLCLDIEKFFDSIDPQILKRSWVNLLNLKTLPDHHYAVFKAITRASYIDLEKLLKIHPYFDIKKLKYFKNSNKNSLFEKWDDLRKLNDKYKIIHRYNGKLKKGIPQGTPISAALSNLYFLEVDIDLSNFVNTCNGIYRRYSDDILIVCETKNLSKIKDYIHDAIEKKLNLKIQKTKTQESYLFRQTVDSKWNLETFHYRTHLKKSVISYLGFDFDGEYIRVRNSSISNFYKKIRRRTHYARLSKKINKMSIKAKDEWIFRRSLFKSSSHLGVNLKKKRSTSKRGNYIAYLYNAANRLPETNRQKIISQIRNHWKIIYKSIKENEEKYELPKPPKPKMKRYKRYKTQIRGL
ncbi:reverse transcriptase domain-containing protein [Salmonirosea aquatica]|uniref:reverse transcriptase domain-containing protein n=1 Tax=Salmonirosea aquatica TaxID=2654236 RepID=UPI003570D54F